MNKKEYLIMVGIVIVIVLIILGVKYVQNNHVDPSKSSIECIANNSILYATTTCGSCHEQLEILGDNVDLFNIVYCDEDIEVCKNLEINQVPTWILNGKKDLGIKTLWELKEIILEC